MKKRLFIFGSCVTRDAFNSRFVADWSEYYEIVGEAYQTSLLSIVSPPVTFSADYSSGSKYAQSWFRKEIEKNFLSEVCLSQPDVIVFDLFTDARFECIPFNSSFITDNEWKLREIGVLQEFSSIERLDFNSAVGIDLIESAFRRIKTAIDSITPRPRVILNSTRASHSYLGSAGKSNFTYSVDRLNSRWNTLESIFIKVFAPIVVSVPDFCMVADERHPWGLAPFHYERNFYKILFEYILNSTAFEFASRGGGDEVFPEGRLKCFSDGLIQPRRWMRDQRVPGAPATASINAGVYSGSSLVFDAMLRRVNGFVQWGSPWAAGDFPEISKDNAIYGGFLVNHYGHFLTESISRLWARKYIKIPVAFQVPEGLNSFEKLPRYMIDIFRFLGLNNDDILLVDRLTAFKRIYVPEQTVVLDGVLSRGFFSFLKELVGGHVVPVEALSSPFVGQDIYLSRSKLGTDSISGADRSDYLLGCELESCGFRVIHPQELPFIEQLDLFENSRNIVGFIGSAFHTMPLCRVLPNNIVYLCGGARVNQNYYAIDRALNLRSSWLDVSPFGDDIKKVALEVVQRCVV